VLIYGLLSDIAVTLIKLFRNSVKNGGRDAEEVEEEPAEEVEEEGVRLGNNDCTFLRYSLRRYCSTLYVRLPASLGFTPCLTK